MTYPNKGQIGITISWYRGDARWFFSAQISPKFMFYTSLCSVWLGHSYWPGKNLLQYRTSISWKLKFCCRFWESILSSFLLNSVWKKFTLEIFSVRMFTNTIFTCVSSTDGHVLDVYGAVNSRICIWTYRLWPNSINTVLGMLTTKNKTEYVHGVLSLCVQQKPC